MTYLSSILKSLNEEDSQNSIDTIIELISMKNVKITFDMKFNEFYENFLKKHPNETHYKWLLSILSANYIENCLLSLDDKEKLQILTLIATQYKNNLDHNITFIWVSSEIFILSSIFNDLQDFNDTHKKIKNKGLEDAKFFLKFLEVLAENGEKSQKLQKIMNEYVEKLCFLIERCPSIFKVSMRNIENLVLRVIFKPEMQFAKKKLIKLLATLMKVHQTQGHYPEKIGETLKSYIKNLVELQHLCLQTNDTLPPSDTLLIKIDLLFQNNDKINFSLEKLTYTSGIIFKLIRKILTNLVEDTYVLIDFQNIFAMFEILFRKVGRGGNNVISPLNILSQSDFSQFSGFLIRNTVKILNSFIQIGKLGLSKYMEWIQNAIYYLILEYKNNETILIPLVKVMKTCVNEFKSQFFEFSNFFLTKNPNLLNIIIFSLEFLYQNNEAKSEKVVDKIQFSKKIKKKKNIPSISLSTKTQSEHPLQFLEAFNKQKLAKLVQKSFHFLESYLLHCSPLPPSIPLLLSFETFFSSLLRPSSFALLPPTIQTSIINCVELAILNITLKGEETNGILPILEGFLACKEGFGGREVGRRVRECEQRVYLIKKSKRVNYVSWRENEAALEDYVEKGREKGWGEKNDLEEEDENEGFVEENVEKQEKEQLVPQIPTNKLENHQSVEKKKEESWKIELPSSFFLSDQTNEIIQQNEDIPQVYVDKPKKDEVEYKEYDLRGIEDLPKAVIDLDD